MKELCIRECVAQVLGQMKIGEEITGWELHNRVALLNPKYEFTYPDTILRELRKHWREQFICCDYSRSKYRRVK